MDENVPGRNVVLDKTKMTIPEKNFNIKLEVNPYPLILKFVKNNPKCTATDVMRGLGFKKNFTYARLNELEQMGILLVTIPENDKSTRPAKRYTVNDSGVPHGF